MIISYILVISAFNSVDLRNLSLDPPLRGQ